MPDASEQARVACETARQLAEDGRLADAAREFERALSLGDSQFSGAAAFGLAVTSWERGDTEGARAACRSALSTGDREHALQAAYHLARSCQRAGDLPGARQVWQDVLDTGDEHCVAVALFELAGVYDETGDTETAEELLRQATATSDTEVRPLAAGHLGALLLQRGEVVAAGEAFTQATNSGHGRAAAQAWVNLGVTHLERAVESFHGALGTGEKDVVPLAIELLARTLVLRGEYQAATDTWERGLDHGDPVVADEVRARLRREFANPDSSTAWWELIIEAALRTHTLPRLASELFDGLHEAVAASGSPRTDLTHLFGRYEWAAGFRETTS